MSDQSTSAPLPWCSSACFSQISFPQASAKIFTKCWTVTTTRSSLFLFRSLLWDQPVLKVIEQIKSRLVPEKDIFIFKTTMQIELSQIDEKFVIFACWRHKFPNCSYSPKYLKHFAERNLAAWMTYQWSEDEISLHYFLLLSFQQPVTVRCGSFEQVSGITGTIHTAMSESITTETPFPFRE